MSSRFDQSEIHVTLRDSVRAWAQANLAPEASERDAAGRFDGALFGRLSSELGVTGLTVPESMGGAGLDMAAPIVVIEALAEVDPAFSMSYLSQELLFTHQLWKTWDVSDAPIPARHAELLRTRPIAGMGMTEPDAGTDVLGMRTTATQQSDGSFDLNGSKMWITNAPVGDAFLVYARTGDARKDISLFLVESDNPGMTRGAPEEKMGMRSSPTGSLTFSHCILPPDALVGTLHLGLRPMLRNLAIERLGLAAESCGLAKTCLDILKKYMRERHAFGKPIADFGQIQRLSAECYANYRACRCFLYNTLEALIDGQAAASVDADAVKLVCTEMAERVSRTAIQVLGANGYSRAWPVERLHRDAILLSIGGGTNEALQKNISRLI